MVTVRPADNQQQGFILIVVIWVMAMLSLAAVAVTRSVQAHIRHTAHQVNAQQSELAADAGVTLAMLELVKAQGRNDASATAARRWPIDGRAVACAVDATTALTISVQDAGGRISLNTGSERLFQALFLGLGASADAARHAAAVLMDFRDADELRRPLGAEKPEYLAARRTLGPKNEPFDAVEELHQVLDVDARTISAMKPHITLNSGTAGLDPRVTSAALSELVARGASQLPNAPLTSPAFGDQKATLPAEFIIGSPQRSFHIVVSAEVVGGAVFVRDAVVELAPGRDSVPNIKSWRRGVRSLGTPGPANALPPC